MVSTSRVFALSLFDLRQSHSLFRPRLLWIVCPKQHAPLNRRRDSASNQTVKPVVVRLLGADLPFINRTTAALGADAVFRREMFGE